MKIPVLIALVVVLAGHRPVSTQGVRGRQQSSYGAPRPQQGFGGGRTQQGFGGGRPQQGFGGGRPQQQGFGEGRPQQGFGGGRPQQGFGGRPQQQGFGEGRPQQGFEGGRPQQGFGGRPQQQGFGGRPQQQGFGGGRPQQGLAGRSQQQVLRGGRPQQGNRSPPRGGGRAAEQNFAPANYDFQWEVNDPQNGNDFAHQEERAGESTRGEYRVLLPDSRIMRVVYTINGGEGYVADVQFEGEARPAQAPRTDGFNSGQQQFQSAAPSPDYSRFG